VPAHADLIVAGDGDLFALNPFRQIPIVTPAAPVMIALRGMPSYSASPGSCAMTSPPFSLLEALRKQSMVADLAQRHVWFTRTRFTPARSTRGRRSFKEQACRAFDPGVGRDVEEMRGRKMEKRYAKMGQLTGGARSLSQEVRQMSAPDRRALVDRNRYAPSIRRQCLLLGFGAVAFIGSRRPPMTTIWP
jgi:hypothetical protein